MDELPMACGSHHPPLVKSSRDLCHQTRAACRARVPPVPSTPGLSLHQPHPNRTEALKQVLTAEPPDKNKIKNKKKSLSNNKIKLATESVFH